MKGDGTRDEANPDVVEYGPPVARTGPRSTNPMGEILEVLKEAVAEARRRTASAGTGSFAPLSRLFALSPWRLQSSLVLATRSLEVDEFGYDPKYYSLIEPMLEFFYSRYWRVEPLGLNNVPREGRVMLVANHAGSLPFDAAMVAYSIRRDHLSHRQVRPLLEDFVFHQPFLGSFLSRMGAVRASRANAQRLLESGQAVLVFPEGIQGISKPFSQRYRLQRFGRGGFVRIAVRTNTPVVPVAVVGSEEIYPLVGRVRWVARSVGIPYVPVTPFFPWLGPLGLLPLPSKWLVHFGEPMDLAGAYGPRAAEDNLLTYKVAEKVRSQVQEMVEDLRRHRRGLFG